MQTPISFILDLLLDEKETLPPGMQKKCKKYVRELESGVQLTPSVRTMPPKTIHGAVQAASTQKILDEMAAETGAPIPAAIIPKVSTAQRIQGGEVNTGAGTRGPKKW